MMRLWPCVGKEGKTTQEHPGGRIASPSEFLLQERDMPAARRVGGSSHRDGQGTRRRAANEEWGRLSRYPR